MAAAVGAERPFRDNGVAVVGTWVGVIVQRYMDWKAIKFIEGVLDRDE